ncbi:hypothetical protein OAB98_00335 [Gammaproteobacteria bacterium]|nr:hypothetical protein [Gammaproteobacteria bacterium]
MNVKKNLIIKVLVIAIPTYAMAIFTEAMVYTMPMLAITTLIATNLSNDSQEPENRIDEDGEDGEDGESLVEGSMFGDG